MSRAKELLVVILDVGRHMHHHLDQASKILFLAVQGKILYKPQHEVALIFFGTTETNNAVNRDDGGYENISVAQPLSCPNLGYLTTLTNTPRGLGPSDFMDAVTVALDMLARAGQERDLKKLNKKLLLLSNFQHEAKPVDDEFRAALAAQFQQMEVKFDAVEIKETSDSPHYRSNMDVLHAMCAEVSGSVTTIHEAADLAGHIKVREVAPSTAYKGPLSIGSSVHIQVRVFKKSHKESIPTLKKYSDQSQQAGATHEVVRSTELKAPSNPDEPVPPEETVKAYRYGKQFVKYSKEDEQQLGYFPEKGFQVLGFVDGSRIPRHHYLKDTSLVLPDLDERSQVALSAIVRACHKIGKVAIARGVLRAKSSAFLSVLVPSLGTTARPDCFHMNVLPFAEDVRNYSFPTFDGREEVTPSTEQLTAVMKLLRAMDLTAAAPEKLQPDSTHNPTLQRFFLTLGLKALNPEAPVPPPDAAALRLVEPHLPWFGAELGQSFEGLQRLFKTEAPPEKAKVADKAAARDTTFAQHADAVFNPEEAVAPSTRTVGTANPVTDFQELVEAGQRDTALQQLQEIVHTLVGSSVGERGYEKALQCMQALRSDCVTSGSPRVFNDFLSQLVTRYKAHPAHSGFWNRVTDAGITLISSDESDTSEVSAAQAADFLRIHTAAVKGPEPAAAEPMEEDEFAGME